MHAVYSMPVYEATNQTKQKISGAIYEIAFVSA